MTLFHLTTGQLETVMLIFVRLLALCFTAPIFSSQRVPVQLRAGMAILLAFLLQPLVAPVSVEGTGALLVLGMLAMKEAVIGVVLGYTANLIFQIVPMAGELQDTQSGFGFAGVVDPNFGQSQAILGQFQMVTMWLIFFALNGHHLLMRAVVDSFTAIPPGSFVYHAALTGQMVAQVTAMMMMAVRIAAPVVAAVLLTDLGLGMLQRTAPQLNLIAVGFPAKIALSTVVVMLSLPFLLNAQGDLLPVMTRWIHELFVLAR